MSLAYVPLVLLIRLRDRLIFKVLMLNLVTYQETLNTVMTKNSDLVKDFDQIFTGHSWANKLRKLRKKKKRPAQKLSIEPN